MRVLENRFYETVKLPKSPYVDETKREGEALPVFPPQGYDNNEGAEPKRGAR